MSHEFRSEQKTIPLPHWDEDDEGEPSSEDDTLLCKKSSKNEFIAQFDDPFEQSPIFQSKEFIDLCCSSLEKKNLLYELLFEERLNGKPNRDIARKYKLSVRQVENIRKKINRHITSIH